MTIKQIHKSPAQKWVWFRKFLRRGHLKSMSTRLNQLAHAPCSTTEERHHLLQAMYHIKAANNKGRDDEAHQLWLERKSK